MLFSVERDGATGLRLKGELDWTSVDRLQAALKPFVHRNAVVRLDLTGLTFMDSSALAVIIRTCMALGDGELILTGVHGRVERLLESAGVTGRQTNLSVESVQPS